VRHIRLRKGVRGLARFLLLLAAMTGLGLTAASPAEAHGIVQRTEPAANASLRSAPAQVVLYLSEPADPALSSSEVVDREGKRVSTRSSVSPDGRELRVELPAIPQGVYTVKWRALWPADGHTTRGFFLFAVGEEAPAGPSAQGQGPGRLQLSLRWLGYLAALLLSGIALFRVLVLRPALEALDSAGGVDVEAAADSRLRALSLAAGVVLAIGATGEFLLQAAQLLGASVVQAVTSGLIWTLLGGTRAGWGLLVRLFCAFLLLLPSSPSGRIIRVGGLVWLVIVGGITVLFSGPGALAGSTHVVLIAMAATVYGVAGILMARIIPDISDLRSRVPQARWAPPVAAAFLLGGITMTAHASGEGVVPAVLDWLHLIAAAAWIGGLAALLAVLAPAASSDRTALFGPLVYRFSPLAGSALAVLIVTGLINTWQFVPDLRAFVTTAYGRLLLAKLVLVLPLAALGAVNYFVLRPRLRSGANAGLVLRRLVAAATGEVGLGVVILLIVAVLTVTPTSRVVGQAPPEPPLTLAGFAGEWAVELTIVPARPGVNRFAVRVTDETGQPLAGDARILLRATKLDDDFDPVTVRVAADSEGVYGAEDAVLGLPGWWQLDVVVRLRGRLDEAATFPFYLAGAPSPPLDAAAVRLLQRADAAMRDVSSWGQVELLTDGRGNAVVTRYEVDRPDRLRYRTSSGNEAVIIGPERFFRSAGSGWTRDLLGSPFSVESYIGAYWRGAQKVARGRPMSCGPETCIVLLWETPGRTAALAGWIGERSGLLRRIMMVGFTESHYMILDLVDFNARLRIQPPQ